MLTQTISLPFGVSLRGAAHRSAESLHSRATPFLNVFGIRTGPMRRYCKKTGKFLTSRDKSLLCRDAHLPTLSFILLAETLCAICLQSWSSEGYMVVTRRCLAASVWRCLFLVLKAEKECFIVGCAYTMNGCGPTVFNSYNFTSFANFAIVSSSL